MTPVLEPAVWWVGYDALTHLFRGGYTLCGRGMDADDVTLRPVTDEPRRCARCTSVPDGHASGNDMRAVSGITDRQLHWWCTTGLLKPDPGHGTGRLRTFPPREVEVVARMAPLVYAGLNPEDAARVARGGPFAPGIRIVFDTDENTEAMAA